MNNTEGEIEFEGQDVLELSSPPHQMGINTQVRIAKEQSSIFEILRREGRGDLVLAPDFQRENVWDKKHKSELVESILMGIPIPLIYLFEDEDGVRQIIDGKQRITALKEFINNEYNLSSLSMLPQLKGLKFNEISPLLQAKFEDYQLHSYIIQPPTPELVKFNIFERVNRGGINLNKQEMRHALYLGRSTTLIHELAESQEFKLSTGNGVKPNRMRDRYLVLRFIAFYLLTTNQLPRIEYRSDVDSFLASVMKFLNTQAEDSLIEHVKSVCLFGMKNVYQILGYDAFRFKPKNGGNRRPVNMGLFEMIVFALCYIDPVKTSSDKAIEIVDAYKTQVDEQELFSGSIDTSEYVKTRFETAQHITQGLKNA
jgi:hypothetical protein